MKTSTVAAAAAGLVGTALADSSSAWADWSASTADPVTTSSAWNTWTSTSDVVPGPTDSFTWPEYSPTGTEKDPQAATTWADWSATTDDGSKTSSTWSEWTSTSTQWDPETTWAAWTSTSSDPSTWADWSSTDDSAQTTAWSAWTTADPAPTSSWEPWTEQVTTIVDTSTSYVTVTVYPVSTSTASATNTWSTWSASATTTNNAVNNVAASSWASWSTSSASAVDAASATNSWDPWQTAQCAIQVITSYGQPVWYPTPVLPVSTASASSTWADWSSTASSSTWSAEPTSTWSAWSSSSTVSAAASSTWASWSSSASSSSTSSAWGSSATGSNYGYGHASNSGSSSSSSGSYGQLAANGNKLGMTYSPYTASGGCKDASTVASDIAQIAALGFSTVRVYSTDCSTLENVGSAAKTSGIKVILGVFISSTGISGAQPQVDAIVSWAQWDLVELIVVGNEAIFNNYCSASDLAGFISSSKSAFKGAGYSGLVTTTEELSIWQSSGSELCDVIDITAANLYAFFNAETTADQAGSFIQAEITELEAICPGKQVYAMECGWPSAGECNGVACPSPENQKTALTAIQQVVGAQIVFFSFEDELWKQPGQFNVEQHWGCADVFGATPTSSASAAAWTTWSSS